MNILVVGSGAREHAIAWSLSRSAQNPTIYIAPGNAGTATLGTNVPTQVGDIDALLEDARRLDIDLTIVGPEGPLVDGVVDRFQKAGHRIVGPTAAAARLEGSKEFAKDFMSRHGIPTAKSKTFGREELTSAIAYVEREGVPMVLKADGLAAGKGVIICETIDEARRGLQTILVESAFGSAGARVVIEEFMEGEEASIFAVSDGTDYTILVSSQDHKRIGEGDTGPNTGGMGAYAPAPVVTGELMRTVDETIIKPTLQGMQEEDAPFAGFLYCGIMVTSEGPKVVEFNCRLGDPEAQVVLPMLKSDFVDLMDAVADKQIGSIQVEIESGSAACVIMASEGYPASYPKGRKIEGLDDSVDSDVRVFFGGVEEQEGALVTSGGRVLAVSANADHLASALDAAYKKVDTIHFSGAQFRRDIGHRGLARLAE